MSLHEPPGRASSASSSSLDGENRENLQNTTASLSLKNWLRHVSTEPAMLLYMCSVMIKFPVFQQLLYEKACWQKYAPEVLFFSKFFKKSKAKIDPFLEQKTSKAR
jgi:hypothetical protein